MTENQLDILRIGPIDVDIVELPCCPPGEVVICGFGEWCPYGYPTPTPYDTITPTPTTPPCSCYIIKNNSPRIYSCSVNYIECSTGSAIAYLLFAGEQLLICSLTTPFIFGDVNCSVQIISNGYCSNGISCDCTPTPTPTQTPTPSPSPSPTTSPTPTQTPTPTQILFQNIYDCCTDRLIGTFVNLAEPIYNLTDGVYYFDNLNNAYTLSPPTVTLTGCYYIVSGPRSSPIIFYGYTSATPQISCAECIANNDIICVPPTATPTPTLSPTIWITLPPTATPTPTLYCSCYTVFLFGFTASANFAYNDCSGLPVVSVINQGETYNICASSTPISRSDDFGWAPAGECDENCITPTPTPSSTPTPTPTPTPPPSPTPLECTCYVMEYNAGIESAILYTDCETGTLTSFIPIWNSYSAITLCSATVPVGINVTFVSGPTPSGLCDPNGDCNLQLTCYEVTYTATTTTCPCYVATLTIDSADLNAAVNNNTYLDNTIYLDATLCFKQGLIYAFSQPGQYSICVDSRYVGGNELFYTINDIKTYITSTNISYNTQDCCTITPLPPQCECWAVQNNNFGTCEVFYANCATLTQTSMFIPGGGQTTFICAYGIPLPKPSDVDCVNDIVSISQGYCDSGVCTGVTTTTTINYYEWQVQTCAPGLCTGGLCDCQNQSPTIIYTDPNVISTLAGVFTAGPGELFTDSGLTTPAAPGVTILYLYDQTNNASIYEYNISTGSVFLCNILSPCP